MSNRRGTLAQLLLAAVVCGAPAHSQTSNPTAFVTLCCNAPATVTIFNPTLTGPTRTIQAPSGGGNFALSPDGSRLYLVPNNEPLLKITDVSTGAPLAHVYFPVSVNAFPSLVVASPDGTRVYVLVPLDSGSSTIFAVDTATNSIVHTLHLPALSVLRQLVISRDGSQLYGQVQNGASNYFQIFNTATLTLGGQIPVAQPATGLAVTSTGLVLLPEVTGALLVIDPKVPVVVNTFPLPAEGSNQPGTVIASRDGQTAYLAYGGPSILAIDLTTGATLFDAPVNATPLSFVLSPDGSSLYFVSSEATVSKFDIATRTNAVTVAQPGPLSNLALSPAGGLFVLSLGNSAVASVDIAGHSVAHIALGGSNLQSIAAPFGRKSLWVSALGYQSTGLSVLDTATDRFQLSFPGKSGVLAFSPSGAILYDGAPSQFKVLDGITLVQLASIPVPPLETLGAIVPAPNGKFVYYTLNFGAVAGFVTPPGEIVVVDTSTYKPVAAILFNEGLGDIAITPDSSTLVCTSNSGQLILVSTATNTKTGLIQLSLTNGFLDKLGLSPDGKTVYVTDSYNNLLFGADLTTGAQTSQLMVGFSPSVVDVTPDGTEAWVITGSGLQVVSGGMVSRTIALPLVPSNLVFVP